ncbi:MAG TPA: cation:proton antiporter [Armatimonadota bacterium]|jgi:Kef-type K+ transport system membrane component KefB
MDHSSHLLLQLTLMFGGAKLLGELFRAVRLPGVVGELLAGVLLGPSLLAWVIPGEVHQALSELGVVILLFSVGLETHVGELRRVGTRSLVVAVGGIVVPFALGYGLMVATGHRVAPSLFLATAMVATSVGVTAQVLTEARALKTRPARIILGAAVLDDILGMMLVAVVAGASQGRVSPLGIAVLSLEALGFVLLAVLVGAPMMRQFAPLMDRPPSEESPLLVALGICLGLAWLAGTLGLAAIIGAFLAGMIVAETRHFYSIDRQIRPVAAFLVPFFFVVTGARMEFGGLATPSANGFLLLVVLLAVLGKVIGCGLAAWGEGRLAALIVGIGMVPRGEVGLLVAAMGLSSGVLDARLYAVVVAMSLLTTLLTPWPLERLMHRAGLVGSDEKTAAA